MPELTNATPCTAALVPLIDAEGRNVAVVVVKGTFDYAGEGVWITNEEQAPFVYVDERLDGTAGPVRVPSDLCPAKPATDIILVRPAGPLEDAPIFGRKIAAEIGPVRISGTVTKEWAFGPLPPDHKARRRYAGTYDQAWTENRMPLLPSDFDPRFHQVAPSGQIARGYLQGDEQIKLGNLYEEGKTIECALPGRTIIVGGNILHDYFTRGAVRYGRARKLPRSATFTFTW
jgi:hypothetical protein